MLLAVDIPENELGQKSFFPALPNFETLFLWNL
jgi:hypothetical protein